MSQPSATLNQALAHHQAGRFAAALALYRQVQRLVPGSFDAWHLGGTAALQAGDAAAAEAQLARALQLRADHPQALLRLGITRGALGRLDSAVELLRRAAVKDPRAPEPWEHLAAVEWRRGRLSEALAAAQGALALRPESLDAFMRVANLVVAVRGMAAGVTIFEEATKRWPKEVEVWRAYGTALANMHRPGPALEALARADALRPGLPGVALGRGLALQEAGRPGEAAEAYGRVLAAEPAHPEAGSARLLCLQYLAEADRETIALAARAFGEARPRPAATWRAPAARVGGRLRVAVVSPDLRRHAVAAFFLPLLRHLPTTELEVRLYHDHPLVDEVSAEFRGLAAGWTQLAGLPHEVVRDRLRADAPDVLLDLAGHTGFNRLPVYAERVAPVQVNYLGYPGTTGLAEMDFRLTDELADPTGETDALHTERLVRFSACAWAFEPPAEAGEVEAPLGGEGGRPVVFGSFNTLAKVGDATLRLWVRVLEAVPGSRLLLKGHGLDEPSIADAWRARFAALGGDPGRLDLAGRIAGTAGHLALYAGVDVALDPFPYHGTTTTCEALWMGRPVVVLAGREHRSRVGVSLLTAAGHPEWIANSENEYVEIAAELGADLAGRKGLAARLRADLRSGALLDHAGCARDLAAALIACGSAARSGT